MWNDAINALIICKNILGARLRQNLNLFWWKVHQLFSNIDSHHQDALFRRQLNFPDRQGDMDTAKNTVSNTEFGQSTQRLHFIIRLRMAKDQTSILIGKNRWISINRHSAVALDLAIRARFISHEHSHITH